MEDSKIIFIFIDRLDYLHNPDQQQIGVEFRKIVFPNNQDFVLPEFSYFGYPQLSLACRYVCFSFSLFIHIN
jgi:hypothetical protein